MASRAYLDPMTAAALSLMGMFIPDAGAGAGGKLEKRSIRRCERNARRKQAKRAKASRKRNRT